MRTQTSSPSLVDPVYASFTPTGASKPDRMEGWAEERTRMSLPRRVLSVLIGTIGASEIRSPITMVVGSFHQDEQSLNAKRIADTLSGGGFVLDPAGLADHDPLPRTATKYNNLLDTSLSPQEASQMLGASVSKILQRLRNRTLYGKRTDDSWRIFSFQFEGERPLPGLEEVLPLLHEELHPIAVYNWFINPNIDLVVEGEPVSPRQWLLSGRDVAEVARIAIDV